MKVCGREPISEVFPLNSPSGYRNERRVEYIPNARLTVHIFNNSHFKSNPNYGDNSQL